MSIRTGRFGPRLDVWLWIEYWGTVWIVVVVAHELPVWIVAPVPALQRQQRRCVAVASGAAPPPRRRCVAVASGALNNFNIQYRYRNAQLRS